MKSQYGFVWLSNRKGWDLIACMFQSEAQQYALLQAMSSRSAVFSVSVSQRIGSPELISASAVSLVHL